MTENQQEIIDSLSAEIGEQARQCAAEQFDPRRGPDDMDKYIDERKRNVACLRRIRQELEDLFVGWLK